MSITWPSVKENWIDFSKRFEGYVPWMYEDRLGLMTTGMGNLIDSPLNAEPSMEPTPFALSLPWMMPQGTRATPDQIRDAWKRVRARADLRPNSGLVYGGVSELRLPKEALGAMIASRFNQNERILGERFPHFQEWPADAQMALHSMAWALGPGFRFNKFEAAANKTPPDFLEMAKQSTIQGGDPRRNAANKALFESAANVQKNIPVDAWSVIALDLRPSAFSGDLASKAGNPTGSHAVSRTRVPAEGGLEGSVIPQFADYVRFADSVLSDLNHAVTTLQAWDASEEKTRLEAPPGGAPIPPPKLSAFDVDGAWISDFDRFGKKYASIPNLSRAWTAHDELPHLLERFRKILEVANPEPARAIHESTTTLFEPSTTASLASFGAEFGREFGREFGGERGPEFGREFGREFGADPGPSFGFEKHMLSELRAKTDQADEAVRKISYAASTLRALEEEKHRSDAMNNRAPMPPEFSLFAADPTWAQDFETFCADYAKAKWVARTEAEKNDSMFVPDGFIDASNGYDVVSKVISPVPGQITPTSLLGLFERIQKLVRDAHLPPEKLAELYPGSAPLPPPEEMNRLRGGIMLASMVPAPPPPQGQRMARPLPPSNVQGRPHLPLSGPFGADSVQKHTLDELRAHAAQADKTIQDLAYAASTLRALDANRDEMRHEQMAKGLSVPPPEPAMFDQDPTWPSDFSKFCARYAAAKDLARAEIKLNDHPLIPDMFVDASNGYVVLSRALMPVPERATPDSLVGLSRRFHMAINLHRTAHEPHETPERLAEMYPGISHSAENLAELRTELRGTEGSFGADPVKAKTAHTGPYWGRIAAVGAGTFALVLAAKKLNESANRPVYSHARR
jgi:hypothetical protein